eukprot:1210039-Rhodomonas_salina.1
MKTRQRLLRSQPLAAMFSILESVAFDTGYAGSNGLEPQSWVNGNGTSYIYFGSGQFDGQGSGHDFSGTVSSAKLARSCCACAVVGHRVLCREECRTDRIAVLLERC